MLRRLQFTLPLLLLLLLPTPALAEDGGTPPPLAEDGGTPPAPRQSGVTDRNCLGQPHPKAVMNQLLGIKYGDLGLEHQLRVGACVPLWKRKGLLFDLSHIEAGFVMHTSPIYVMPGAYVRFAPLSVLSIIVEGAPVGYWPINVSAAGYYPLAGYESDYRRENLPAEDGATAGGWYVRAGPNLQLAAPLGPLRLIILDSFRVEHFQIGPADFYLHNRNDLPAARQEWFLDNMAIVLVEVPLSRNLQLRLGVNDQATVAMGGKKVSNAVRGVAMLNVPRVGRRIRDLAPMLAIGGRTNHPVRQGDFNIIVAFSMNVELSKVRADEPPPEPMEPS